MLREKNLEILNACLDQEFKDAVSRDPQPANNPIGAISTHELMPGYSYASISASPVDVIAYVLRGTLNVVAGQVGDVPIFEGSALRISARANYRLPFENHSSSETVKFLQVMIKPDRRKFSSGC